MANNTKFTLTEIIWLSLAVALFIIGLHQSITVGFMFSYWIFMFAIGFLFAFRLAVDKRVRKQK